MYQWYLPQDVKVKGAPFSADLGSVTHTYSRPFQNFYFLNTSNIFVSDIR